MNNGGGYYYSAAASGGGGTSTTNNNNNKMNLNMLEPLTEMEDGLEPLTRARSNTWPLPRPENYVEGEEGAAAAVATAANTVFESGGGNKCLNASGAGIPVPAGGGALPKKNSSRRNAWGNLSYADLITQAITTSPDKRLTLSQIYEWMVQNVPYFKDKGDSNSSAGWKNSIRHNLSLHNRFMRVQNEGTGKSSWWMINPDAKPGKSVRRRAASMETSKFEKRRGRVKKKVEIIRNGGLPDTTPSPSSSVSESLDVFPDSPIHSGNFQLSPDFRPRASSNTSSCGRLSPIPSVVGVEPDWSTAPGQFNNSNYSPDMSGNNYSPDQLAGNLEQGMKLQNATAADAYLGYMNGQQSAQQQQPPPPPQYSASYDQFSGCRADMNALHATSPYGLTQCPIHRITSCSCMQQQQIKVESMSPGTGMSPSYPHSEPSPDPINSPYLISRTNLPRPPSTSPPLSTQANVATVSVANNQGQPPSTMMGQLMGALNSSTILDDLNINVESLQGGFDCNVEELIKHELNMEGSLDFNFPNQQQQQQAQQQHHHHHHPHQQQQQQQHNLMSQQSTIVPSSIASELGVGGGSSQNNAAPPPPPYSTTAVTAPSWVH